MRFFFVVLFVVIPHFLFLMGCSRLNHYQTKGELSLPALKAPVRIDRDEKGMAYVHAQNLEDAVTTQGFVTAQDRLFQMEMMRLLSAGRISEVVGDKGLTMDIQMRTIGLKNMGARHAAILSPEPHAFIQHYVDGVNAFIELDTKAHHLEFSLAGIQPSPWSVADALSILYLMSWQTSADMRSEMLTQLLNEKLGLERARELFPININTAEEELDSGKMPFLIADRSGIEISDNINQSVFPTPSLALGSNSWIVSPSRSSNGKPILANDPHLDSRVLPGPWYPCGLITPTFRVVGAGIPGIPGMVVFRTNHIAVGVTNAYGDCQDLYIEKKDTKTPGHYLQGEISLPFEKTTTEFKIKDKHAPGGFRTSVITIRRTQRGPVVSDCFPLLKTGNIVSLRWAPAETMSPEIGIHRLMLARTVAEVQNCLSDVNMIFLNFIFSDSEGNIAWKTSGKLPIRTSRHGAVPLAVTDSIDDWQGWIPHAEMPGAVNPSKGWIANCNNATISGRYPYYYSSYFSPSYRYRRISYLLDSKPVHSADDHWQYQLDTKNLLAENLSPIIATALNANKSTEALGRIISDWDFHDKAGAIAATVFQELYLNTAWLTFKDELGEQTATAMLSNWYFWQERFQKMFMSNDGFWFDDIETGELNETRDDIIIRAGEKAIKRLTTLLGSDPSNWSWGKLHRIEFVSPIRREGIGKGFLGGGSHPASGSGETLLRGSYSFDNPYSVTLSASLRMVADMGDPDKILAVLPGGVAGRVFHPHAADQILWFIDGKKTYWWFSDAAIREHSKAALTLSP